MRTKERKKIFVPATYWTGPLCTLNFSNYFLPQKDLVPTFGNKDLLAQTFRSFISNFFLSVCFFFVADIPSQVPPLTPGTNKKMAEALKATFASWEKEQLRLGVPKGESS